MAEDKNKFRKKAMDIIEDGIICLYDFFDVNNDFLTKDAAVRYFTLCFYTDHKIKFVSYDKDNLMFGPSEIMFNGDILIGISSDINKKDVKWKILENILIKELKRRDLLNKKSLNKMFDIPFNMSVRNFLANNFADNVITAKAELEEFGNTQTGALYKSFLDENDELRKDFFKELSVIYKKDIMAKW